MVNNNLIYLRIPSTATGRYKKDRGKTIVLPLYEVGGTIDIMEDVGTETNSYTQEWDGSEFSPKGRINKEVYRLIKRKKNAATIEDLPDNVAFNMETKKFFRAYSPTSYEALLEKARLLEIGKGSTTFNNTSSKKIKAKDFNIFDTTSDVKELNKTFNQLPASRNINKALEKVIKNNPQNIRVSNNQVINFDTMEFVSKNKYFKDGKTKIRQSEKKIGWKEYKKGDYERQPNSALIVTQQQAKQDLLEGPQPLYYEPKTSYHGASVFQQYDYTMDEPQDIDEFISDIRFSYDNDFTIEDKSRPNRKVLLSFGIPAEFRIFPLDDIEDLETMLKDYADGEVGSWGGSDFVDFNGNAMATVENLQFDFYRIILSGTPIGGARNNSEKGTAKWWFLNQPPTKNNECLEGAIKRGLNMKERVGNLRKMMVDLGIGIEMGKKIDISYIGFYEFNFQVNINIYTDTQHLKDGVEDNNLLRGSKANYNNSIKILLKDEHYSLIKGPKKCMRDITRPDCRILGYDRDGKASVLKLLQSANLEEKQDPKKLIEKVVIFDNETIFDKKDNNFLKVYGVSWFVWDFNEEFDYNDGWNEDKTHNFYHDEPYCYYKRGENCIDELIKFLLNPPAGIIYKPMGFNNSRFDNYSFCESAMKFKVLEDLFLADGSILYTRIKGIANVWDASRFLVGMSLDSACKSYATNPKKMPDLINHYEIQCYYELNGWEGLNKLLDSRQELVLYNKIDCICLADLTQKLRNAYLDLFQEDVFKSLTISSMGYKICMDKWEGKKDKIRELYKSLKIKDGEVIQKEDKKWLVEQMKGYKPKHTIYKADNYQDDLFHRKSMVAGRTQSFFGKLDLKMPLAMCDVKSLYPTIMGSYADDCPMPYGKYYKTDKYVPNKLGIYNVRIIHQRCKWKGYEKVMNAFKRVNDETGNNLSTIFAPNVIAKRSDDKPLDWFYKGEIKDLVLTSVDIEVLKWATEDEKCIEIGGGHYWKESKMDLFTDFIEPAKQEKSNQDRLKAVNSPLYNQAKREGCKLSLNSLSGKLLEAIHENESKIFNMKNYRDMEQDEKITELNIQDFGCGFAIINGKKSKENVFNDTKRNKRKPAYLGMFVYSYSRKLMYEKLLSRYLCLYMDTDSACMPLFEWERCCEENKNNGLIDTGEFGCLEEEVCHTDKATGEFIPADRLIAISPKNYAVINTKADFMSKRKFKGVRKTDVWLPLSHFKSGDDYTLGYIKNEKGKLEGSAIDKIKGNKKLKIPQMTQDQIRRMRENNCCLSCIDRVMEGNRKDCIMCINGRKKMKKAYTTEMFQELVEGRKIAVFCSMINKIKYRIGDDSSSQYIEELGNKLSVEEMEVMCSDTTNNTAPMEYTISHRNMEVWRKAKAKFKAKNKKMSEKELKASFVDYFQRFRKINNEKEINTLFKLKQTYMIKII